MVEGTLEYEAAIMNAAVVPSLFAVHLAAHHALLSKLRGSLRTRSLHSELVCNLSGSKHVSPALGKGRVGFSVRVCMCNSLSGLMGERATAALTAVLGLQRQTAADIGIIHAPSPDCRVSPAVWCDGGLPASPGCQFRCQDRH